MARLQQILSVLCVCVSVCMMDRFGQVQSPLYPKPYPTNVQQQWDLEVPHGYQLQITFNYLDIEPSFNCYYDSLTVLHSKKILGKFCGQNSTDSHHPGNKPILSPSNRLQLVFVTDESNADTHQHLGFSAFYQAVDIDECSFPDSDNSDSRCAQICLNTLGSYLCACYHGYQLRADQHSCVLDCSGGVFTEPEGVLSSPGYPNAAPLGVTCLYSISVQPGFQISLNFSDSFHIEQIDAQGPSCLFHWLQLSVPGEAPIKLCGDQSPGIIHTGSHTVDLEFHTDGHGQSGGFNLRYTTQRVECKIEGGIQNGRITPNFPKYFFRDYIQVRCDTGYKLMMGEMEIKSYRSMCQENGRWHLPLPECRIIDCGEPRNLLNGGYNFLSGSNNEYQSVVQYNCHEPFYSFGGKNKVNLTCAADRKWRGLENEIFPYCAPVCGRPSVVIGSTGRVLGGSRAEKHSFPWQVFLKVGGRGGAIVIGEKWLLTAAHNLEKVKDSKEEVEAYVGSNNVNDYFGDKKDEFLSKPLPIESLHVHPGYKSPSYDNDIALIKLTSPITFKDNIMPVCLPEQDANLETFGWVSGFGLTESYDTASYLRYIRLPVVDQTTCHSSIKAVKKEKNIDVSALTDNMFCAGLQEGGKDTCQGDSGSGFVMKNKDVFYAAGIVSWGIDCGIPGRYGMYTRIARYTNWIQEIMEKN
ncbi:hypothetical protein KOW79_000119 [Hemibagrus wyckioides]|uniref:complement subcomponent C1r n=1 Tax=Hemibagrus wyckioides TaxID=337641 RepID=A0A9D3P6D4_9TELE|nr:complement C1r subcomponent-like [Hemibagrus wyckioides]KAG7335426.1 hypothetical protein KOW79_000119 [Hemibagrus wyckioides]